MASQVRSRSLTSRDTTAVWARLGETVAVLAALALAGAIWWLGAWCTLTALRAVGIPVHQLGLWQWLIPIGASVIELLWWPNTAQAAYKGLSFTVISALDVLSTFHGAAIWARNRSLPLATGITVPTEGAGLIVPAAIVSIVFTFVPERLGRWAVRELWAIWTEDARD